MTDAEKREKVIEGLEYCAASCKGAWDDENGCPYMADWIGILRREHGRNGRCVDLLCADALALLKVQEAIRPGVGIIHNEDGSKSYFLHCPIDGTTLDEGDRYCRKCGRAVKWE